MRLSPLTLEILKNFATINTELYLRPSSEIWTCAEAGPRGAGTPLIAYAEVEDLFPVECGIYDLNRFLAALSVFNNEAEIEFTPEEIILQGAKGQVMHYPTTTEEMLKWSHLDRAVIDTLKKNINGAQPQVLFDISQHEIVQAQKAAAILSGGKDDDYYYTVIADEGKVRFGCSDERLTRNKTFFLECGHTNVADLVIFIKRHTFGKVLNRDYKVAATNNVIQLLSNDVTYYMATVAPK
jgi:hypothetical protein